MPQSTLEQRVAVLEQKVEQILAQPPNGSLPWLRTMGMFGGDQLMKEVFGEALKYRQKDRERARRRYAKKAPPGKPRK